MKYALILIAGIIIGMILTKTILGDPISIIIDTSNEKILDKALLFHGLGKCDYILGSGHSFMRKGQRCAVFNLPFRQNHLTDITAEIDNGRKQ